MGCKVGGNACYAKFPRCGIQSQHIILLWNAAREMIAIISVISRADLCVLGMKSAHRCVCLSGGLGCPNSGSVKEGIFFRSCYSQLSLSHTVYIRYVHVYIRRDKEFII